MVIVPVLLWMAKFDARRVLAACLPALTFALTAGCVSYYENPPLPISEVAVLEFVDNGNGHGRIRVDGRRLRTRSAPTTLHPGEHNIAFRYGSWMRLYSSGVILNAKAGHSYELRTRSAGDRIWTWVIDKGSNEVVAGTRPP